MRQFENKASISIESSVDIVVARHRGRALANQLGFSPGGVTLIATLVSELARHVVECAGRGEILMTNAGAGGRSGIELISLNRGRDEAQEPSLVERQIAVDFERRLSAIRSVVDEFRVVTATSCNTAISLIKWKC